MINCCCYYDFWWIRNQIKEQKKIRSWLYCIVIDCGVRLVWSGLRLWDWTRLDGLFCSIGRQARWALHCTALHCTQSWAELKWASMRKLLLILFRDHNVQVGYTTIGIIKTKQNICYRMLRFRTFVDRALWVPWTNVSRERQRQIDVLCHWKLKGFQYYNIWN